MNTGFRVVRVKYWENCQVFRPLLHYDIDLLGLLHRTSSARRTGIVTHRMIHFELTPAASVLLADVA